MSNANSDMNSLVHSSVSQTLQTIQTTVECNMDKQPNKKTSSSRFSEIGENIGNCLERSPMAYTSEINNILINNENIDSSVSTSLPYEGLVGSSPIESNSKTNTKLLGNNWLFNTSQRNKNSTKIECSDNTTHVVCFTPKLQNTRTIPINTNDNQIMEALNEQRTSSANISIFGKTADNISVSNIKKIEVYVEIYM